MWPRDIIDAIRPGDITTLVDAGSKIFLVVCVRKLQKGELFGRALCVPGLEWHAVFRLQKVSP